MFFLQCLDALGWVSGMKGIQPVLMPLKQSQKDSLETLAGSLANTGICGMAIKMVVSYDAASVVSNNTT